MSDLVTEGLSDREKLLKLEAAERDKEENRVIITYGELHNRLIIIDK